MNTNLTVWADYARPVLIVIAALLGYLAVQSATRLAVRHLLERRGDGDGRNVLAAVEFERRVRTLERLSLRVVLIAIALIAALTVLATFDVNIGPAVVGLGVVGLAVGFGAQTLVKDWLAGIFVVLENQYSQGDVVRIAGVEGVVEDFSLRRTVLRDADGTIHSVPNGQIVVASNLTRVWAPLNLHMRLDPAADADTAVSIIGRVAGDLGSEPAWAPRMLGTPTVHRVEMAGDAVLAIEIVCQVLAGERLTVIAELRRRIADALSSEGIAVRAEGT